MTQDKYKCPECCWVGKESEMTADCFGDEQWSNWICPSCGYWHIDLDDYINVESGDIKT